MNGITSIFNFIKSHPTLALFLWFGWTVPLCFLLLSPSEGTVRNISSIFGGTEITDAIGHIIMIGTECVLMYLMLTHYVSDARAPKIAAILTLLFGIFLETAQLWIPSRGASWVDIVAAFIGVGCAYLLITKTIFNHQHEMGIT